MKEVELLNKLETTPDMDDAARQAIYNQVEAMMKRHLAQAQQRATGIRDKTYFKPGGYVSDQPQPDQPAAPSGTKPTLREFIDKARLANPGASDSELARFWKNKYGG